MKKPVLLLLGCTAGVLSFGTVRLTAQSAEDPIAVPVHVNAVAPYDSLYENYFELVLWGENSSPTASDGTVTMIQSSTLPPDEDSPLRAVTRMQPDKAYYISIADDGLTGPAQFSIVAPPGYTVEIDGSIMPTAGDGYHLIQIISDRQSKAARAGVASSISSNHAYWQVSLGTLQNGTTAGWLSLSDMGYGSTFASSLFTPAGLQYESHTPVDPTDEVSIHNDDSSNLNQVMTDDCFVNVVTINGTSYRLDYYNASQVSGFGSLPIASSDLSGLYPYMSYTISEGTSANQLVITSNTYNGSSTAIRTATTTLSRTGSSWPYDYALQDWHTSGLTAPVNVVVDDAQFTGSAETTSVQDGSGTAALNVSRQYYQYGWGPEISSKSVGTSNPEISVYAYDNNSSNVSSYGFPISIGEHCTSTSGGGSGQYWTGIEYAGNSTNNANDGIIYRIHRQYLGSSTSIPSPISSDSSSSAVTTYGWTDDEFGALTKPTSIQTTLGVGDSAPTLSGSTFTYTSEPWSSTWQTLNDMFEVLVTRTDTTNTAGSGGSLVSTSSYYREDTDDEYYANQTCSVTRPDGTMDAYAYQWGSYNSSTMAFTAGSSGGLTRDSDDNCTRTVVFHGTTQSTDISGSNTQITSIDGYSIDPIYLVTGKSTRDVTIRDQYAHIVYAGTDAWMGSSTGWVNLKWVVSAYNLANLLTSQTSSDGSVVTNTYTGDQLTAQEDATGITTSFGYDAAGRVSTSTPAASGLSALETTTTFDAASHVLSQTKSGGGTESIVNSYSYDDAGRLSQSVDPDAGTTSYAYSPSTLTTTVTLPNSGTKVDVTYPDGHPLQETGTGVVPRYFTYSNSTAGLTTTVNDSYSSSPRYQAVTTDMIGRITLSVKPTSNSATYSAQNSYDSVTGQLTKTARFDSGSDSLASTLYLYDSMGQCYRQGLDVDGDGTLSLTSSTDRIVDTVKNIESSGGNLWATTTTTTYPTAGSGTGLTTSVVSQQLNGLGSGLVAEEVDTDTYGTATTIKTMVNTSANTVTTQTTNPGFSNTATIVKVAGLVMSSTGFDGLTTSIGYDGLWRPVTSTDSRGNTTTSTYITDSNLVHTTADPLETNATYTYDTAGRLVETTDANGKNAYTAYNTLNEVIEQWGDTTHPVEYGYDGYGQRTTMKTFQNGTWTSGTWPGEPSLTDTTTWTFDEPSGLVTKKTDAAGNYAGFSYTNFGQLYVRTWARGTTSTYSYDSTGAVTGVTYSDTTPSVSYAYTRSGQLHTVTDGGGTRTFYYSNTSCPLQLTGEQLDSTFYGGRWLTHLYEPSSGIGGSGSYDGYTPGFLCGRPCGIEVGSSSGASGDVEQDYARDTDGRLLGVHTQGASASRYFVYTYLSSSDLVSGYSDITSSFSATRSYEPQRDLLSSIQGKWGSTVVTEYDYVHNNLYQTSSVQQSGTAFTNYGSGGNTFRLFTYDSLGQLKTDTGYLGAATSDTSAPLPDRKFAYGYDQAGNRSYSNYTGSDTLKETYTTNNLNQYTARENLTIPVSGYIEDSSTANVALDNGSAAVLAGRQGGFWAGEALPPLTSGTPVNASAAAAFSLNVTAGDSASGANNQITTSVSLAIPAQNQTISHDSDGNLTNDGSWAYVYDAENRVIQMTADLPTSSGSGIYACLGFAYDYMGRRIDKKVGTTTGSSPSWTTEHRYIYDGWNLVADYIYSSGWTLHSTFAWGLDLNGDLTDGGVGSLLEVSRIDASGGAKDYFATYNETGNVASLVSSSGAVAAVYEYSPFGESLQANVSDSTVSDNPFRFSTKFTDTETGRIYYGHRFYDPHFGRFLNRDPLEEMGGNNLYGFCDNDPVNGYDELGNYYIPSANDSAALSAERWNEISQDENEMSSTVAGMGVGSALAGIASGAISVQAADSDFAGEASATGTTQMGMEALQTAAANQNATGNFGQFYSASQGGKLVSFGEYNSNGPGTLADYTYDSAADTWVNTTALANSDNPATNGLTATSNAQNNDFKISLLSGGVRADVLNPTFSVSGIKAGGLQAIQTVYVSGGPSVGSQIKLADGKTYSAFVDGGINSPYAQNNGGPAQSGSPYYLTPAEVKLGVTWNGTSGTITVNDAPTAQYYYSAIRFETIIVATNYNNSGKDVALGAFQWGYNGGTPVSDRLVLNPIPSANAITIINHDYPNYHLGAL